MNPVQATLIICGTGLILVIGLLALIVTFPTIWGHTAIWIDRRMTEVIKKHADADRARRYAAIDAEHRQLAANYEAEHG